jgi:hypothetical protein
MVRRASAESVQMWKPRHLTAYGPPRPVAAISLLCHLPDNIASFRHASGTVSHSARILGHVARIGEEEGYRIGWEVRRKEATKMTKTQVEGSCYNGC